MPMIGKLVPNLFVHPSPAHNNNQRPRKSRRKANKKRNGRVGVTQPTVEISRLPVKTNRVTCIRRALQRTFTLNAAVGIDGYVSFDMQIVFYPDSVNWRIGGVSIYTDNVPNITEFTSLFENWRLKSIVLLANIAQQFGNSGATVAWPLVMYAPDYNNTTSATKLDLLQYPQVKIHSFAKDAYTPLMYKFSPKPLRDVAGSGVSTSYGPMSVAPWLRTADTQTPHYGIKQYIDFVGTTYNQNISCEFTVFFETEFTNPY